MDERQRPELPGPDFLCIGQQKAGTRWIYDQLLSASGVWMPPIKELNYFTANSFKPRNVKALEVRRKASNHLHRENSTELRFLDLFEQGMAPDAYTDSWYLSLFAVKNDLISGDVSPSYATLSDKAVSRVAGLIPNARIILMLRHPVERANSALSQRIRIGDMSEDDLAYPEKLQVIVSRPHFTKHSLPSVAWTRWVKRFGEERCRYFFLDDIRTQPEKVRNQVAEFLGLESPRFGVPADLDVKRNDKRYDLPQDSESFLYEYYKEEILRCRELFGNTALHWKIQSD